MSIGDGLIILAGAIVWAAYVLGGALRAMIPRNVNMTGEQHVVHRTKEGER